MAFTYPRFDVTIERRVVSEHLAWPASGEAMNEGTLGCNRSYVDLRRLTWLEARRVYSVEDVLLARIETSSTPNEEHGLIEDELYEDAEGIYGLDIGVASAVVALSAARCVPFSSCNGGAFGGCHHESHPVVALFARPETTSLLVECAEEADCGLLSGEMGHLVVYANDIRNMRAFSTALIGRRSTFRQLRFSSSRSGGKKHQRHSQDHKQCELF